MSPYISYDTLEHISFHDCLLEGVAWEGPNLTFTFECLEVLATHPHNPGDAAKSSDRATITFEGANLVHCRRGDNGPDQENYIPADLIALGPGLKMLTVDITQTMDWRWHWLAFAKNSRDHAIIYIVYDRALLTFGALKGDS